MNKLQSPIESTGKPTACKATTEIPCLLGGDLGRVLDDDAHGRHGSLSDAVVGRAQVRALDVAVDALQGQTLSLWGKGRQGAVSWPADGEGKKGEGGDGGTASGERERREGVGEAREEEGDG